MASTRNKSVAVPVCCSRGSERANVMRFSPSAFATAILVALSPAAEAQQPPQQPTAWNQIPRMQLERQFAGPLEDTHPALARPCRRNHLLRLPADHRPAFAADRFRLCAVRRQYDRIDQLRRRFAPDCGRPATSATRRRRAARPASAGNPDRSPCGRNAGRPPCAGAVTLRGDGVVSSRYTRGAHDVTAWRRPFGLPCSKQRP